METNRIQSYLSLLQSELVPAAGCTEPIAIAYCAATMREVLGGLPDRVRIGVSGNILKNAKSVTVPLTGGRKGIPAAVAAGIIAGDPSKELLVISNIPADKAAEIRQYADAARIELFVLETDHLLDIEITGFRGSDSASVRIVDDHGNIVRITRNGETLRDLPVKDACEDEQDGGKGIRLSVRDILDFIAEVPAEALAEIFEPQIACNTAIAEEGLKNDWGAGIGRLLLESDSPDVETEAKAYAAAGSDARMSGCELPVVIVSGSGNQGITASLPVIRYALRIGAERETLHRALAVSALVTLQQKSGIGKLSAYCGAVCAGVGAGAGIAWLLDGSYHAVAHTIINAAAIISGTLCDGAKPSCAAKIASAVDAGILGFKMFLHKKQFCRGEGIVDADVDSTIANIGIIAKNGMAETDRTIIDIIARC
jgi:L-cysteine desulfidase